MSIRKSLIRWLTLAAMTVAAGATTVAIGQESNQPRPLTIDDYAAVKWPGSVSLSPDGSLVAFAAEDRLHVVDIDGNELRAVTSTGSSASSPLWSADGSALYFISDRSGSSQLWKLPVETFGEAEQLTELERGVYAINLSPDESRLLLTLEDAEEESSEAESSLPGPWVIDRLHFKADAGDGYLTARPNDHVYVYDLADGQLTQITSGRYAEEEPAWSPDGETVVFVSTREPEPDALYKTDLWLVSAGTDETERPLTRLTNDDYVKSSPKFSPDGGSIAYLAASDGVYGQSELAIIPATGGEPRMLTRDLDRWIQDFEFSADGRFIYFSYDDEGGVYLARLRVGRGTIETLAEGPVAIASFDVSDNGRVAVTAEAGNRGREVYRVDGGDLTPLTAMNAPFLQSVALGEKTSVSFESSDGTRVQTFVTTPPGFSDGRRYPAVLKIHGGPVGQFSWGYDFGTQYLATRGYVVVEPNPRGSTGRGQAFIEAIYRTWGITDYPDVIGAIDHVVDAGIADADRLAVTGYSYGGYMTNVVITRSDRFKAAASGAGHSFIAANFGHDIYQKWYNWELGPPWEFPERYEPLSPLLDVDQVETPTIFLGGQVDWNVPVLNAELFYQSLKVRGIDTRLVVYPDMHHGGWPDEYQKDYLQRAAAWFDTYVR